MHPVHRFTRNRPRLVIAFASGLAVGVLLPGQWGIVARLLIGWNVAIWSYLVLMGWLMMRANPARIRKIADQEDEGAVAVLAIMSIAAAASLGAIIFELASLRNSPLGLRLTHYAFTALTVFGSWCLVAVIFTFHYARTFYKSPSQQRALRFPEGEQNPDYWDFLYFSFTIAVAAQTSDVTVMTREMRKTVLAQSVLSFIFNAAIFGLSINIAAGILGA